MRFSWDSLYIHRGVVPVGVSGARGAMAPPDLDRSVNPISTKGSRLCPPPRDAQRSQGHFKVFWVLGFLGLRLCNCA